MIVMRAKPADLLTLLPISLMLAADTFHYGIASSDVLRRLGAYNTEFRHDIVIT